MSKRDHLTKIREFIPKTSFGLLQSAVQDYLFQKAQDYNFGLQEFKQVIDWALNFDQWEHEGWQEWFDEQCQQLPTHLTTTQKKEKAFSALKEYWNIQKLSSPHYTKSHRPQGARPPYKLELCDSGPKIYGECPVASEKTVCCQLKTIDVVQNCAFGCHYCSIQTFYNDKGEIGFEKDLAKKLEQIPIDPKKNYHFGTGQSSDALLWGNQYGILSDLCRFAQKHPNILLEFKTKSKTILPLLQQTPPKNILCSWSLNTQTLITHEEPLTASLEERLSAAEEAIKAGLKVAFHFHPLIRYTQWKEEYKVLVDALLSRFHPKDIAFISIGTLTFIKPVIKQIKKASYKTKILQMPFEEVAGRYSYPTNLKQELFSTFYSYFAPWHEQVFFYLCMEPKSFWLNTFGYAFDTNDKFEETLFKRATEIKGL